MTSTLWIQAAAILALGLTIINQYRNSRRQNREGIWKTLSGTSRQERPMLQHRFLLSAAFVVAVVAGSGFLSSASASLTPEVDTPAGGTTLWVFKLPSR